jgi:hypothetical protein
MKAYFTLLVIVFIGFFGSSQTSILFDATKAETANNADWIVDADSYNLLYDPFPELGGNEANAQRIPTPSQSGITSGTSEWYWDGAISAWAVDAVKLGYSVETLPYNGSITYGNTSNAQDLSNYEIYVVCEPNILFSASEKTAILTFIQNGGGLFMISDHDNSDRNGDGYDSPYIWNDLMTNNTVQANPFGMAFDYEYFNEATTNIPYLPGNPLLHGSYGDVTRVEFYGGTSMTLNPSQNASVKGVVYMSGYTNTGNTGVMCAYATYGSGKVVGLGDSSPADDGSGDDNDNLYDGWIEDANGNHERLIMNATIWLADASSGMEQITRMDETVIVSSSELTGRFLIENGDANADYTISVYTITGQTVITKNNVKPNQIHTIDLPGRGMYIYEILNNNMQVKTGKILL